MTKKKVYDLNVPLFLIATAIARGVKKQGGRLFRISVVRTEGHQYLIKYKCRARDTNHSGASAILSQPAIQDPSPDDVGDHD